MLPVTKVRNHFRSCYRLQCRRCCSTLQRPASWKGLVTSLTDGAFFPTMRYSRPADLPQRRLVALLYFCAPETVFETIFGNVEAILDPQVCPSLLHIVNFCCLIGFPLFSRCYWCLLVVCPLSLSLLSWERKEKIFKTFPILLSALSLPESFMDRRHTSSEVLTFESV